MKMIKTVATWMIVVTLLICILVGCGTTTQTSVISTESFDTGDTTGSANSKEETQDVEISVFIAASLSNVMEEIQTMYSIEKPNVTITYNGDSSGTLQMQIQEGAVCDIFFSAATRQMTALSEEGFVKEGSVINLLQNDVVLIKPVDGETEVTGFEDITKAENLALAGEDVPVGAYARDIFTNLGILEDVQKMEINEGTTVTAVLAAVSEMSNEVGVVYATDAVSMKDSVEVIAIASENSLDSPVIYPVGQIVNSKANEKESAAAKAFLEYLTTDEAGKVFEEYGFTRYQE